MHRIIFSDSSLPLGSSPPPGSLRFAWVASLLCVIMPAVAAVAAGGKLTLHVVDEATEAPLAARLVLQRADGRSQAVRRSLPAGVGVAIDGQVELGLPDGPYRFELIRGPEYRLLSGHFSLERNSLDEKTAPLVRMVDMREEGWVSGDLLVDRQEEELPLLMRSDDLAVAVRLAKRSDGGSLAAAAAPARLPPRARGARPGEQGSEDQGPEEHPLQIRADLVLDRRDEGGLLLLGELPAGMSLPAPEASSGLLLRGIDPVAEAAEARGAAPRHAVVENPFAWDLPLWLASGRISGFVVLGDFLRLDRPVTQIERGREPSRAGFTGPHGPGRWAEQVYWQLLEAGLRIPPMAASGAGIVPNPVGYNRVYVHCGEGGDATPDAWWQGLWAGRSVVTNGPLLRPTLGGELPGHVFRARQGEVLEMYVELQLATRDPVDYLEVIHNGRVFYSARLDDFARAGGEIPPLRVEESGWVVVRVMTAFEDHFRAALSAPWYLEFEGQRRVSREAVEFFQDWLAERESMLAQLPEPRRAEQAPFVRAARAFWAAKADSATVD